MYLLQQHVAFIEFAAAAHHVGHALEFFLRYDVLWELQWSRSRSFGACALRSFRGFLLRVGFTALCFTAHWPAPHRKLLRV